MTEFWTQDKVECLTELWNEGVPGPQIAEVLGTTHSAVRSKRQRIGLVLREKEDFWGRGNREDRLVRLWNDGAPLEEITNILGCTRGAVLGKRNRLGLPIRDPAQIQQYRAAHSRLDRFTATGCEYGMGNLEDDDFRWCNKPKLEGFSYCDGNTRRCYQLKER